MGYVITGDQRFDNCFFADSGRGGREGGREGMREGGEGGRGGREVA